MKSAVLVALVFLSVARPAIAQPINGLIAASLGTLALGDNVSVAANINAGRRISVWGLGLDFVSTEGFCGLGRSGAGGLLIAGSSRTIFTITAPVSDLYLYLCVKNSGLSGEFAAVLLDGLVFPGTQFDGHADRNVDLEAIVNEAIDRKFGR